MTSFIIVAHEWVENDSLEMSFGSKVVKEPIPDFKEIIEFKQNVQSEVGSGESK